MTENQANNRTQSMEQYFFRASAADFKKIPGSPIAYWASHSMLERFVELGGLSTVAPPKKGLVTSDNGRFLRKWFEVSLEKTGFNFSSRELAKRSSKKWFPINAGGAYRKWFGNAELLVNWENDGEEIIGYAAELYGSASRQIQNTAYYFKKCITWSNITSSVYGARQSDDGFIFGAAGTVEISSLLTKVFKSVKRIKLLGFSGLMLAVTEDNGLAQASNNNEFDIRALLTYSAVCGIGLDTVPIPGDTSIEKIAALIRDTGTMAFRLNKPLTVRLFPVPGLSAGDMTTFISDDLCNCRILAVP